MSQLTIGPRLSSQQAASLLGGGSRPDPEILARAERIVQAFATNLAFSAYCSRLRDLVQAEPGPGNGKEEVGIGLQAGASRAPPADVRSRGHPLS